MGLSSVELSSVELEANAMLKLEGDATQHRQRPRRCIEDTMTTRQVEKALVSFFERTLRPAD